MILFPAGIVFCNCSGSPSICRDAIENDASRFSEATNAFIERNRSDAEASKQITKRAAKHFRYGILSGYP